MGESAPHPVIMQIFAEETQGAETRRPILENVGEELDRPAVLFYTSERFPVMMEDSDADMLEGMLQSMDLSKGLALVLCSPGGYGLTAERIVNVCRSYSGTGEYWVMVPGKAKSAATMVCFGASKIWMGPTSELGPIDPQLSIEEDGHQKYFRAQNIIRSYDQLFEQAVKTEGNLEPFLQQLDRYDERDIEEYREACELSTDIALKTLASGMMEGTTQDEIKKRIAVFLTSEEKKSHGRPIYRDEAEACGLAVEKVDGKSELWRKVYELHLRAHNFVTKKASKCIESVGDAFAAAPPSPRGDKP